MSDSVKESKLQIKLKKIHSQMGESVKIPSDITQKEKEIVKNAKKCDKEISSEGRKGKVKGIFSKKSKEKSNYKRNDLISECQALSNLFFGLYSYYVEKSEDTSAKSLIDSKKKELLKIKHRGLNITPANEELSKEEKVSFGVKKGFKTYQEAISYVSNEVGNFIPKTDQIEAWKRERKAVVKQYDLDNAITLASEARDSLKTCKSFFQKFYETSDNIMILSKNMCDKFKNRKYVKKLKEPVDKISEVVIDIKSQEKTFMIKCDRIIKFGEYVGKKGNTQVDFSPLMYLYIEFVDLLKEFCDKISSNREKSQEIDAVGKRLLMKLNNLIDAFNSTQKNMENSKTDANLFKLQDKTYRVETINNSLEHIIKLEVELKKLWVKLNALIREIADIKKDHDIEYSSFGYFKKFLKIAIAFMTIANLAIGLLKSILSLI